MPFEATTPRHNLRRDLAAATRALFGTEGDEASTTASNPSFLPDDVTLLLLQPAPCAVFSEPSTEPASMTENRADAAASSAPGNLPFKAKHELLRMHYSSALF